MVRLFALIVLEEEDDLTRDKHPCGGASDSHDLQPFEPIDRIGFHARDLIVVQLPTSKGRRWRVTL